MWRDCWIVLLSRPARALWIEITPIPEGMKWLERSRPARALWIEIALLSICSNPTLVEAREGLVD